MSAAAAAKSQEICGFPGAAPVRVYPVTANSGSGATLIRPGLERVRDLAAEGQIQAVLVHAPDRLSRKYAYQILLIEEFARHGVETLFVKSPQGDSAEDQLLVQFQGMIAEYERAQIMGVFGAPIPHDSALTSAGAQLFFTPNWSLLAKFDGEFAKGSQLYAGSGTLRYTW